MSGWRSNADAAAVDLTAARLSLNESQALEHLREAAVNVEKAIDALETEMGRDEEDDPED